MHKIFKRLLEYGARNSQPDLKRIQEIHDTACALGARCNHENMPGVIKDMGYSESVSPDPTTLEAWHGASAKGKRCVADVMKQGKDMSAAIAICRASLGESFTEAAPVKYAHIDFNPPESVSKAALRGLALRKEYGRGGLDTQQAGEQGIGSGVARARDLAGGGAVSPETVRRMVAFFARHVQNKDTPPAEGNGQIAWLLWGGDPGKAWAEKVVQQMEAADKKVESMRRRLEKVGG